MTFIRGNQNLTACRGSWIETAGDTRGARADKTGREKTRMQCALFSLFCRIWAEICLLAEFYDGYWKLRGWTKRVCNEKAPCREIWGPRLCWLWSHQNVSLSLRFYHGRNDLLARSGSVKYSVFVKDTVNCGDANVIEERYGVAQNGNTEVQVPPDCI